jgi:hypothetical protein
LGIALLSSHLLLLRALTREPLCLEVRAEGCGGRAKGGGQVQGCNLVSLLSVACAHVDTAEGIETKYTQLHPLHLRMHPTTPPTCAHAPNYTPYICACTQLHPLHVRMQLHSHMPKAFSCMRACDLVSVLSAACAHVDTHASALSSPRFPSLPYTLHPTLYTLRPPRPTLNPLHEPTPLPTHPPHRPGGSTRGVRADV